MVLCGWCHTETAPDRCSRCGRDPALPWVQRGKQPPTVSAADRHARRMDEAAAAIRADGYEPTVERIAERLEVDPRTVRRWRSDARVMSAPRPSPVTPRGRSLQP